MKRLAAIAFFVLVFGVTTFAQVPSLTITCETPGLPCDLFYGNVKVKPVRLRPPGTPSQYWCVGAPGSAITIDHCDFFIQQQYIDFLKRFPEPSCPPGQCGLDFYVPIIAGCNSNDTECIKYTRGALSANFFRSPEFRGKGAYVANLYNVTIGHRPTTVQELQTDNVDRPHYGEFFTDLTSITAPTDAETNMKKDQLATAFLGRTDVINALGGYTPSWTRDQLVTKLEQIAGVTLANRNSLINGSLTHAQILRQVAESTEVFNKFDKPNFVTMEYFGYLRRDPEDCHGAADPSQCGFIFHNNRFTLNPDPDVIQNIIVRGFIESPEYRNRF